jgi:aminoglycoside phosphotransferase (APT) family kinase protein
VVDLEQEVPGVLAVEFIEGRTGAALLSETDGPATVGRLLGRAWRQLGEVDPTGLPLPADWASPDAMAAAATRALDANVSWLDAAERQRLQAAIDSLPRLLDGRPPGFVHGDFVPVNVIVRDGAIAALIDLEAARLADPMIDAAWFRWIVGYHHPGRAAAAWRAFLDASGLDEGDPGTRRLLLVLPPVRILEAVEEERGTTEKESDHWRRMLRPAVAAIDG